MIRWSEAEEMAGDWRQLLNEERHDLYSATNIVIVIIIIIIIIISVMVIVHRTVRWAGHVARREIEIYIQDISGRPERKRFMEDIAVDGVLLLLK